jgi:hypothetical protein
MGLSAYVFDPLHEGAAVVLCRDQGRTHADPRSWLRRFNEGGHGYILTPVGSRVAIAPSGAIATEAS